MILSSPGDERVRIDRQARVSRRVLRRPAASSSATDARAPADVNTWFGRIENPRDLRARDAELLRVPADGEIGRLVVAALLFWPHRGGHPRDLGHAIRDERESGDPLLEHRGVIALDPALDGHDHANDFLAANLHRARVAVMRRAVHPRGLAEILAPKQEPRALRAANRLAAAVADERRAPLQVHVGVDGQHLRGRIHEHRDVAAPSRPQKSLRWTSDPFRWTGPP